MALQDLVSRRDQIEYRRRFNCQKIAEVQREIARLTESGDVLDRVSAVIKHLLNEEIFDNLKPIEDLMTQGLATVFYDQKISVKAETSESRGKVAVSFVTSYERDDGVVIEGSPLSGFGGSVATVQSVLLRLMLIIQRGMRPMLILDETLPAFDGKYVFEMSKLLSELSKRLGADILLVTHNPQVMEYANKAYRFKKGTDGTAVFEALK